MEKIPAERQLYLAAVPIFDPKAKSRTKYSPSESTYEERYATSHQNRSDAPVGTNEVRSFSFSLG
jgi:hypothetical protein